MLLGEVLHNFQFGSILPWEEFPCDGFLESSPMLHLTEYKYLYGQRWRFYTITVCDVFRVWFRLLIEIVSLHYLNQQTNERELRHNSMQPWQTSKSGHCCSVVNSPAPKPHLVPLYGSDEEQQ